MFDFLHGPNRYQRALPVVPIRRWAVETLVFDLNKVITYRRALGKKVNGSYLFLKYLQSLNVNVNLSDQEFVWAVSDVALRIANSFQLTSAWGHGKPFQPGIFYGPEVTEVLIADIDDFDLVEARRRWQDLEPFRVMSHPYNGFSLPILDGTASERGGLKGTGWAVIVVNLPMLAFQYKCWWEAYVRGNPDSPPGMNLFFNAYPLANLLRSHLDVTMANRLMTLDLGGTPVEQDDPNPFYLNFREEFTDRLLTTALRYMRQRHLTFDDLISAIPQVGVGDFHERLALPSLAFSTQTEWAIFLGRLTVIRWLLAHNAKVDSSFNNPYIVNIRHWMQHLAYGRLYHQGLRGALRDEIKTIVQRDIMPYL